MKKKKEKTKLLVTRRFIWFGRMAKLFGMLTVALVLFYVIAGTLWDKNFVKNDLEKKIGRVAGVTTMVIRVVGPPNEPVLTGESLCQDYIPYVHLAWDSSDQVDYYDIERDGAPLIAGVVENFYDDEVVSVGNTYNYTVTAFNSFGQKISNLASVIILDCGVIPEPEDPICVITRFHKTNLIDFVGRPSTTERRPTFYGTTNMPEASIEIMITGETSMFAITAANEGGYWEWKPLSKFDYGTHTIWATAIDPDDSARRKTTSLNFKIKKEDDDEDKKEEDVSPRIIISPVSPLPVPEIVVSLQVKVKNPDKTAYAGRKLSLETKIRAPKEKQGQATNLIYRIIDKDGKVVSEVLDEISINGDETIKKDLAVPRSLLAGKYKIAVETIYKGTSISAEDNFILKEIPLVDLGGGIIITIGIIMDNLLWIIFWLLLLLLIFLILLANEYRLSRYAIIQITEEMLRKKKLIKRKEAQ